MKKIFISFALFVGVITPGLLIQSPVHALFEGSTTTACEGAALGGANQCDDTTNTTKVNDTIAFVINIMSIIGGIIAVIMLIVGGFKFLTSQGESAQVASARNTIIYSIVGLVVIALAQVIVQFVLYKI